MIRPLAAAAQHTAADTRAILLSAAAREIHHYGFQAASLARILADSGVTKGALYHHFPSKLALGYAVLEERYAPLLRQTWIAPLARAGSDPIDVLVAIISAAGERMTLQDIGLGCPVNNLAQEMSAVEPGFRMRIEALFEEWRAAIAAALMRASQEQRLRPGIDPHAVACFVVASLEGCVGMAKNAQSKKILRKCGAGLIDYLQSLRLTGRTRSGKKHV